MTGPFRHDTAPQSPDPTPERGRARAVLSALSRTTLRALSRIGRCILTTGSRVFALLSRLARSARPLLSLPTAWTRRFAAGSVSLRLRLSVFFTLLLIAAWITAGVLSWKETRDYIDEFFDTQMFLFAKTLANADPAPLAPALPREKDALRGAGKNQRGDLDEDALGFAIFNSEGVVILHDGEKGRHFRYAPGARGFEKSRARTGDDIWRIVRLPSRDGSRQIAVGQDMEYRREMVFDMLKEQFKPWLFCFPVLLVGLLWMLSRELAPLSRVAKTLETRPPGDSAPIQAAALPTEVRPLIRALNGLFARHASLLERERSFVSDAAHELRTPLAGLRIQAEVLGLAADDPAGRAHALQGILAGIDRCNRLVEQLLTLSRLESAPDSAAPGESVPLATLAPLAPLDWPLLLDEVLAEYRPFAEKKGLAVTRSVVALPCSMTGHPGLVAILLRNLVGNAVTYTPPGGDIRITLSSVDLAIENSAPPLSADHLARLGERFFRPPGQTESGSGLGLSIARHIAAMHGLEVRIHYAEASPLGLFTARVMFSTRP